LRIIHVIGIVIAVCVVVFFMILAAASKAQKTRDTQARVDAVYQLDERFVSPVDHAVLGLNFAEEFILLGDRQTQRKFPFSSIVAVEVKENDATITQTNRGSQIAGALAGGLFLGGIGALAGGLTGSTRTRVSIRSLALKLVIDDLANPNFTIWFFKSLSEKGTSPDSILVTPQIKLMERIHAQLLNAIRRGQPLPGPVRAEVAPAHNIAALAKLWEMKVAGALTEEEYSHQKNLLLACPTPTPELAARVFESDCSVVITGYQKKIPAIRAVRKVLGKGLAEVALMFEEQPVRVATGLSRAEAGRLAAALHGEDPTLEILDSPSVSR
jgi:ribosomal protein L7/L12